MKKARLGRNGRIVIPKSVRKEMNIEEGSPIVITYEKGAVVVRVDRLTCRLCGSQIESERSLRLCDKCIGEAVKSHRPNSKNNTQQ